ncbi:DMT family transporter [Kiloniella sp. b19]|uniref:DMT family transporter n=1 Tax=Kiloniella sp. GXU_MW_B19 TaxID=3141326 RepID=UPI0031D65D29
MTSAPQSTTPPSTGRANLIGSLWMILAMAGFAIEDSFIKAATVFLPVAEVLVIFGAGGALIFALIALLRKEALYSPDVISPPMRIRVFFEITGRLFFVLALALTPLSSVTAILQATPIVVVLGAALLFGEKVGWRRWTAIFTGLIGVLIILRPTPESFSPLSILALLGMIGFAGRDLASRAAPPTLSAVILGIYGFLAVVIAGGLYHLIWEKQSFVLPGPESALYMSGAVTVGVLSYASLMKAMRTGDVSTVTPFRYSRLLFGLLLGVTVFGERLDETTLIGSAIVVLSGLFILLRSRQSSAES